MAWLRAMIILSSWRLPAQSPSISQRRLTGMKAGFRIRSHSLGAHARTRDARTGETAMRLALSSGVHDTYRCMCDDDTGVLMIQVCDVGVIRDTYSSKHQRRRLDDADDCRHSGEPASEYLCPPGCLHLTCEYLCPPTCISSHLTCDRTAIKLWALSGQHGH